MEALTLEFYPFYILIAAILHITEEFFYPGGFIQSAKTIFPRLADRITRRAVFIINLLFILFCISGIVTFDSYPGLSLTIAGLIFVNGSAHVVSSAIRKSYSPGLITSAALYIPLAILIFSYHKLTLPQIAVNIAFGILYHLIVPLIIFSPFNKPSETTS